MLPTVTAPTAYPWIGDAERAIREALDQSKSGEGEEWIVRYFREARDQFTAIRTTLALCTKTRGQVEADNEFPAVTVLAKHWATLAFETDTRGLAAQLDHADRRPPGERGAARGLDGGGAVVIGAAVRSRPAAVPS